MSEQFDTETPREVTEANSESIENLALGDSVELGDSVQLGSSVEPGEAVERGSEPEGAFVESSPLEEAQGFLFPGDKGTLDYNARRVFALLLQRRFIEATEDKWAWDNILKYQNDLESRFHDMFLDLVVDRDYAVAYKTQIRQEELNIPILLRDDSYKRAETVILVYLRSAFRQQLALGSRAAFVDHEELTNHAMSFFASDETNIALRLKEVKQGIEQLAREGILKEESQERYRISPIIEVLMPIDRINELTKWLESRSGISGPTESEFEDESELAGAPESESEFESESEETDEEVDEALSAVASLDGDADEEHSKDAITVSDELLNADGAIEEGN